VRPAGAPPLRSLRWHPFGVGDDSGRDEWQVLAPPVDLDARRCRGRQGGHSGMLRSSQRPRACTYPHLTSSPPEPPGAPSTIMPVMGSTAAFHRLSPR